MPGWLVYSVQPHGRLCFRSQCDVSCFIRDLVHLSPLSSWLVSRAHSRAPGRRPPQQPRSRSDHRRTLTCCLGTPRLATLLMPYVFDPGRCPLPPRCAVRCPYDKIPTVWGLSFEWKQGRGLYLFLLNQANVKIKKLLEEKRKEDQLVLQRQKQTLKLLQLKQLGRQRGHRPGRRAEAARARPGARSPAGGPGAVFLSSSGRSRSSRREANPDAHSASARGQISDGLELDVCRLRKSWEKEASHQQAREGKALLRGCL